MKTFQDILDVRTVNLDPYWNILKLPYGKVRREKILEFLKNPVRRYLVKDGVTTYQLQGIPVNRKHCVALHKDLDLIFLLKKNKIRLIREGSPRCRTTYVVLN